MKKCALLFLTLAFVFLIFSAVFAESYKHQETGLVFPDRIAGLQKGRITDYEKDSPGLGISVGYNSPGLVLTIYLYKLGMESVPDDINSPVLRQQLDQAISDITTVAARGDYVNLKRLDQDEIITLAPNSTRKTLAASFSFFYKKADLNLISKLYLMGYKKHFLKIRYSYDAPMQAAGETKLNEILSELAKMLDSN